MRRRSFLAVPLALGWLPARAARVATVGYLAPGGPGGRVTGLAFSSPEGMKMTFRLLGATLPRLKRIHAFATRDFHAKPTVVVTRRAISEERGYVFVEHSPASNAEAERIVRAIRDPGEEAIVVGLMPGFDPATFSEAVLRARVPVIDTSGRMKTGSLLGAGLYHADLWGRLAAIVDQVLRGADPAHIPIEQPTHAEVTLDLRTAAAIGVTFPREVLMRATQIIE